MTDSPVATFANHRGVVPVLWVFVVLASIELVAVHLILATRWPTLAWWLSIVTATSIVWLISWVRSWKRRPHELHVAHLRLHMGSLRHVDVPLALIVRIRGTVAAVDLQGRQARNLVPIAHPNRIIDLREPLPGRQPATLIAVRVDDPHAFDAALASAGVCIGDEGAKARP